MAIFNSYLLGKVRKSVGNITTCIVKGTNIVKAKIFSRKDVQTPEILTQRAKMKALGELSRKWLPVIRKGFVGVGNGTTSNAFVSMNMEAVTVDENYTPTIDFTRLICASGVLYAPNVSVSYDAENASYLFHQEMQDDEGDGFSCENDKVFGVLYENGLKRVRLVSLKSRGETGDTTVPLPTNWEMSNVCAYCFSTSKNERMASDSTYLPIN